MAYPPNYQQERSNRNRAKQRKAEEKQARRDEQSSLRKQAAANDGSNKDAPDGKEENQG